MILETPFQDARPLDAFKDRIITDPVEVIEEVKALTNAACRREDLLAPVVAFVHGEMFHDVADSSEYVAATAEVVYWVEEYFWAKGYLMPASYSAVGSICLWLIRHRLCRADHSRIIDILADLQFFEGEPMTLDTPGPL